MVDGLLFNFGILIVTVQLLDWFHSLKKTNYDNAGAPNGLIQVGDCIMFYLLDKVKAELAYPSASAGITGWYRRMQFVRIEDITSRGWKYFLSLTDSNSLEGVHGYKLLGSTLMHSVKEIMNTASEMTAVEIVNQMGVSAKAEHVNALAAIAESKIVLPGDDNWVKPTGYKGNQPLTAVLIEEYLSEHKFDEWKAKKLKGSDFYKKDNTASTAAQTKYSTLANQRKESNKGNKAAPAGSVKTAVDEDGNKVKHRRVGDSLLNQA